jgi:hypothetical protein
MERRTKRSENCDEALQYLVEALADRSEVSSVVLTNAQGSIVAGMGVPGEVRGLAKIAGPVARGETCDDFERVTDGTDFVGRGIRLHGATYYLAALGSRLCRMQDAVHGVARIVDSDPIPA